MTYYLTITVTFKSSVEERKPRNQGVISFQIHRYTSVAYNTHVVNKTYLMGPRCFERRSLTISLNLQ